MKKALGLFLWPQQAPCPIQQQAHIYPGLPYAADVLVEILPVDLHVHYQIQHQIQLQLAFLIPALYTQMVFLYSSWDTCSYYPFICASFLYLSFVRYSLFICGSFLPLMTGLLHMGVEHSRAWRWFLNLDSSSLQGGLPRGIRSLCSPKSVLKSGIVILLFAIFPPLKSSMPPSHGYHTQSCAWPSHSQLLLCEYEVQQSFSQSWVLSWPCQEVVARTLLKLIHVKLLLHPSSVYQDGSSCPCGQGLVNVRASLSFLEKASSVSSSWSGSL